MQEKKKKMGMDSVRKLPCREFESIFRPDTLPH